MCVIPIIELFAIIGIESAVIPISSDNSGAVDLFRPNLCGLTKAGTASQSEMQRAISGLRVHIDAAPSIVRGGQVIGGNGRAIDKQTSVRALLHRHIGKGDVCSVKSLIAASLVVAVQRKVLDGNVGSILNVQQMLVGITGQPACIVGLDVWPAPSMVTALGDVDLSGDIKVLSRTMVLFSPSLPSASSKVV